MAEMNEMSHWGFSPYESWKVSELSARRPNGTAITGVVLGSVGLAAALGAWVFGPVFSNAKANGIRDLANARYDANNAQIAALTALLGTERAERVAQGTTISQTITDSISGQQSSTLTAQQAAELSSIQSLQQTLLNDAVTGRSSLNPTPVSLYTPPKEFQCGCGCGQSRRDLVI